MNYKLQGLYLKLDKRLKISIDRLTTPKVSSNSSSNIPLKSIFTNLHRVLSYCDSIDIKNLQIGGHSYHIDYKNKTISLVGKEYEVTGMFYRKQDSLELQLPIIKIPSRNVTLSAKIHYRYKDGNIWASGYYHIPNINGSFEIKRDGRQFLFKIDSKPTNSLHQLFRILKVSSEAKEWLLHRLSAHSYQLISLQGEGSIDLNSGKIIPKLNTLIGKAKLKGVHLKFNDKLKTIDAPLASVALKDGHLSILMKNPKYGKHSLEGSKAVLSHLFNDKELTLDLNINYFGRIDSDTLKILKTYNINIDVKQKDSSAKVKLALHIPLVKGKVHIKGRVELFAGELIYHQSSFKIKGGKLTLNDSNLKIDSFLIDEKILKGKLRGRVDLDKKRGDFKLFIKRLNLGASDSNYLIMRSVNLPIKLSWDRRGEFVSFPKFKSSLNIDSKKNLHIYIKDLTLLHPYFYGILRLIAGGNISIDSFSKKYRVKGFIDLKKTPFYFKKSLIKHFPFSGSVDTKANANFKILKGKLQYNSKNRLLQISGINIDLKRLLAQIPNTKATKKGKLYCSKVRGKGTILRYSPYLLLSDSFKLKKCGSNFTFRSQLDKEHLDITKRGRVINIDANNIRDRLLHPLIHFNGISNGYYSIHIKGEKKSGYVGNIDIKGGVLRDFKAYNSLIATINTIPALMTFSSPGFSNRGFEIKRGNIVFTLKDKIIQLKKISLVGESATIVGDGSINLKSRALNVKLAIRTAREMGNALSKIPLVGYIIFGKDKSFTAGVKIRGTIEHPKVNTNPVGEALLYPLDILWRTLKSPAHLINSAKSLSKPNKTKKKKRVK